VPTATIQSPSLVANCSSVILMAHGASIGCGRVWQLLTHCLDAQVSKSENDLMADLEAGLSQPGALARTNGRPMDDSAREDQVGRQQHGWSWSS